MAESAITRWSERVLESNSLLFTILTTVALIVGGAVELLPPMIMSPAATVTPIASVKPYTPVRLAGRDIYIREGCYNCHSQMIRPFKWETDRFAGGAYGEVPYSKAGEYVYDHPFQWGSKRTGPDLSHESQVNGNRDWHKRHLTNPRNTSKGSVMPAYAFLFQEGRGIDPERLKASMHAMNNLWVLNQGNDNVPYSEADFESVDSALSGLTEGDALIEYLVGLGNDTTADKM
jgi:cytochrome c oxidase cbb3-type subunit 2